MSTRSAPDTDARTAAGSAVSSSRTWLVSARPERLRLICAAAVVFVAVGFTVAALLLPSANDGFTFHRGDEWAIFLVGLAVAGLFWLPTRPRVRADETEIQVRTIVGAYKSVPWDVVQAVELRPKWRWARLMLPADETISLYAVQRADPGTAVQVVRDLRALHARSKHESIAPQQ